MIPQMVRNECEKFGRHIDKYANYKILQLKVPNNAQTLHNLPCFWWGCFEAVLIEDTRRALGVKIR
jgi:hypothetical protein